MKRYALLAAVALLAAACAQLEERGSVTPLTDYKSPGSQEMEEPEIAKIQEEKISLLESQLQIALASGGITPEAYAQIDGEIASFESQGYSENATQALRRMLSRLQVGEEMPAKGRQGTPDGASAEAPEPKTVLWLNRGGEWTFGGTPPPCPDPFVFQTPVDLGLVTSILYPGQYRGGDFKPHGGFRADGADGPVEVRAPMEGYIWRVARFTDDFGPHYMFDIQHPCGIMVRLGHLGKVPPKMEAIFDGFPARSKGDSRTEEVEPVFVGLGETIATDTQHGSGFDWGAYDLRKENEASKSQEFRQAHADEAEQAYHALCWFDYLPPEQEAIVRSLPAADGKSGKGSEYC